MPAFTESNPYGQLWFLPFDVDDTWGSYFNQGVDHAKAAIYDQRYEDSLEQFTVQPEKSVLRQEYRNFIREYRDLHWQPEIINGMIDELAAVIEEFVPADRDRWRLDYSTGSPIDNGTLVDRVNLMKQFAWQPGTFQGSFYWIGSNANLDQLANAEGDATSIPNTPTVTYSGSEGYPENDLIFSVSNFSDPQGNNTFEAMKWRIAEYDLNFKSSDTNNTYDYTIIEKESNWKYFKGQSEPSSPMSSWRYLSYDDSNWNTGQTIIGYGDGNANTPLDDMYRNYRTVYVRKEFEIEKPANIISLTLNVLIDDGCIIWINGNEVARLYCSSGVKYYNSLTNSTTHDVSDGFPYDQIIIENASSILVAGTNIIAIHGIQSSINSSDFSLDAELIATSKLPVKMFFPSQNVKYEINPLYETDEITSFANNFQFPAEGVKPGRTYRVRCKMKDNTGRWSHWSAPIEFVAGDAIGSDIRNHFRLTELMYNQGDADFIEFKNTSSTKTLDISTISITTGITYTFANSSIKSLAPGEFVLVVKKRADFEKIYGTGLRSRIAGEFDGKLANGGEALKIEDFWNGSLIEFEYNDGRGWPIAADGSGHSLVPIEAAIEDQPNGTLDYGGNWRASSYIGGSPGADDPTPPADSVLINEFMAHTDLADPSYPAYDSNDWIELFNAGGSAVSLGSSWYLSDDIKKLKKWKIPAANLVANGFISYDEITGFHNPITSGFGLDKAGEKIYLSYLPGIFGVDRIVDAITFAGQDNNVSMGRYPDGGDYWFSFDNGGTRGSANLNPIEHIIISEIMYHPADELTNSKYIEVYNPTDTTVELWTDAGPWQFEGGVDYLLPTGISMTPGKRILFVGFDPNNSTLLNQFMETYSISGLVANANIFGPWSGTLSNNTDRLTLCKPQDSDEPLTPTAVSLITVDQCNYNDYWPWPQETDGFGPALVRINNLTTISSDNPTSWTPADATPGY